MIEKSEFKERTKATVSGVSWKTVGIYRNNFDNFIDKRVL